MIPERYARLLESLNVIAAENEGPAGRLAELVSSFVVDVVSTDFAKVAEEIPVPGLRIDAAIAGSSSVEARFTSLELALTETNRRIPGEAPVDEPVATLFGSPVVFLEGQTLETVRAAVRALPPGLSKDEVVDRLARDGFVRRVGP